MCTGGAFDWGENSLEQAIEEVASRREQLGNGETFIPLGPVAGTCAERLKLWIKPLQILEAALDKARQAAEYAGMLDTQMDAADWNNALWFITHGEYKG